MRVHRRRNGDCINLRIFKKVFKDVRGSHSRIESLAERQPCWIKVADSYNTCLLVVREIADEIRAPVPVSGHTNTYLTIFHARSSSFSKKCFVLASMGPTL